jgi:glutamyl-tRNA reductase
VRKLMMNAFPVVRGSSRVALYAALAAGVLLAGCNKTETPNPPDTAASAAAQAAAQASRKLDQVAGFVDQQLDAAKRGVASAASAVPPLSASTVSAAAQAQFQGAASAVLGQAAAVAGSQLEAAGRKLQQWSQQAAPASAASSARSGE